MASGVDANRRTNEVGSQGQDCSGAKVPNECGRGRRRRPAETYIEEDRCQMPAEQNDCTEKHENFEVHLNVL